MKRHISLTEQNRDDADPPSIFNDVFGPVMIGPSSSHSGAAYRIGRLCLDLLDGRITAIEARYNRGTALANTHVGQGTNRGLYGALLGWEMTDPGMEGTDAEIEQRLRDAGVAVSVSYPDLGQTHASFYHLTIKNENEEHILEAISTGGGMFRVLRIDNVPVKIEGGYHELLVYCEPAAAEQITAFLEQHLQAAKMQTCVSEKTTFVQAQSAREFEPALLAALRQRPESQAVKVLAPVLPTRSRVDLVVPFLTASQMLTYNHAENLPLWELALRYEAMRGGVSEQEVWARMESLLQIMRRSIDAGCAGTEYADRLLGPQAPKVRRALKNGIVADDTVSKMILYTTALMDAKSSMKVFVAVPTAGSCGTTPGAVLGMADALGKSREEAVQAMLAAGLIGVFIASQSTFSAELAGCMAETGSSAAMAAAGMITLLGGSTDEALTAAGSSINTGLGLICDMIGDRVEAPCLEKNIAAGMRAYGAALSARMGFDKVLPFDESVQAMDAIGRRMPSEMCCTGGAGLCQTPTGRRILKQITTVAVEDRPPGSLLAGSHELPEE